MAKKDGKYARQLHRGPATLFSVPALSQVQCRAPCLPHEQVALEAQTQASPERPQHVDGSDGAIADSGGFEERNDIVELRVIALVVLIKSGLSNNLWNRVMRICWEESRFYIGEGGFIDKQ